MFDLWERVFASTTSPRSVSHGNCSLRAQPVPRRSDTASQTSVELQLPFLDVEKNAARKFS